MGKFTVPEVGIVRFGELRIGYDIISYTYPDGSVEYDVSCGLFDSDTFFDTADEAEDWIRGKV